MLILFFILFFLILFIYLFIYLSIYFIFLYLPKEIRDIASPDIPGCVSFVLSVFTIFEGMYVILRGNDKVFKGDNSIKIVCVPF